MTDITELQARIEAAFRRIGAGLDRLSERGQGADPEEMAALRNALEEERTASAQLEERVKAIKERQEGTVADLTEEVERLRGLLEAQESGVARLKRVNGELRANNDALREAMREGVAEPHLINKAMMAELEAVRAAQAADRTELDAVLTELGLLVDGGEGGSATEEREDA